MKMFWTKIAIWVIVGLSSSVYTQSQNWQVVSHMPFPVSDGQAVVKDSLIYILGGFSDSLGIPVNLIHEYNPKANKWQLYGHMRINRSAFIAQKYNDSVIICGGSVRSPAASTFMSMEMWNFTSNPYIFSFNQNFNRIFTSGVVVGGKLYLIGGLKNSPSIMPLYLPYIVEYDIKKDSITFSFDSVYTNIQLPIHQSVSSIRNDIYIFGGVPFGVNPKIFRFNTINKKFNIVPIPLLQARAGAAAINFDDDEIIIIGGYNEKSRALASSEIFSAPSGIVSVKFGPIMNFARRNPMAVKFNNSIYVFGGEGMSRRDVAQVERLDLMTDVNDDEPVPVDYVLHQNYPNPFNPVTTISFKIANKSHVLLEIFNVLGEKVKTLCNEEFTAGSHELDWTGKDDFNKPLSGGVYIYKLTAGNFVDSKKMVLLK